MGRHHSSGPKENGLRQKFRPFFGRIDGEDQKKGLRQKFRPFLAELMAKTKKKVFARNSGIFSDESVAKTTKKNFRRFIAAYLQYNLKKKKDRGPDDSKRSRAG